MRKLLIATMLLCAISVFALMPSNTAHFGIRFNLGFPQGEFNDYVDEVGYGFDADLTYALLPFVNVGIGGGYLKYGEETRKEPFSYTVSEVMVDITTSNNLGYLHLIGRASPGFSVVNPYVEGRFGGAYLWTETKIQSEVINDEDDVIAESKNYDDFAFNAGFGGGIQIRLLKPDKENDSWMYLDLKTLYIYGSNAEYLTEGSIEESETDLDVTYYVSESKTSLLEFQIGVNLVF